MPFASKPSRTTARRRKTTSPRDWYRGLWGVCLSIHLVRMSDFLEEPILIMKRNALAWAAIAISTAALVSSRGVTKAVPAALQISPEGQKQARALGDAFNAVAEYVKPSVVQISVQRKA